MRYLLIGVLALSLLGCSAPDKAGDAAGTPAADKLLSKYTTFPLTTDFTRLTQSQRQMLPLLVEAARAMDQAFWVQAWGEKDELLASIDDSGLRRFAEINYGPWDRLDGNRPFIEGVGPKPAGANFYPTDMSKEEFEQAVANSDDQGAALRSLYTMVRRNEDGSLKPIPYSQFFGRQVALAAAKLRKAATLAENDQLRRYLELRADALESDIYQPSDMAWMEMKTNTLDIVIGPIETYEDQLFGYKASFEAYVLVKDMDWSQRLERYSAFLPDLQKGLPVDAAYKQEMPGTDSELNAYDVLYYAGDCNAGSKTIAINLPNDEEVQLTRGSRRLQLKNAMRAKFDKILVPIANELIAEDQRQHITFDAFFANTMFHEVAHGLGIKNTINGQGTVRSAMKEQASALEEGKADVLGLYMVERLHEMGELGEAPLMDNYVTFIASIFRSIRFGASSAHGRANLVRFNFFKEMGAFTRDEASGTYRIDADKMSEAMDALSRKILVLQGDGDYAGAKALIDRYGTVGPQLEADLQRLGRAGIPVDIVFEQPAAEVR